MRNIVWKYVKPLSNKNAILDFLAENKVELPNTLISLITLNNGGRPSEKDFQTITGHKCVFKSLLSYNKEDSETIYNVFTEIFAKTTLYPIGTDPAGNFICFDRKEKTYVFWDHETNRSVKIEQLPFIA